MFYLLYFRIVGDAFPWNISTFLQETGFHYVWRSRANSTKFFCNSFFPRICSCCLATCFRAFTCLPWAPLAINWKMSHKYKGFYRILLIRKKIHSMTISYIMYLPGFPVVSFSVTDGPLLETAVVDSSVSWVLLGSTISKISFMMMQCYPNRHLKWCFIFAVIIQWNVQMKWDGALQLHCDCPATVSRLHRDWFVAAWWLPDKCLTSVWEVHTTWKNLFV